MSYREYEEQKRYLLYLIYKERLYQASDAANKFNCSERRIFRMLESLKKDGYGVYWNRRHRKYMLENKENYPEIENYFRDKRRRNV